MDGGGNGTGNLIFTLFSGKRFLWKSEGLHFNWFRNHLPELLGFVEVDKWIPKDQR